MNKNRRSIPFLDRVLPATTPPFPALSFHTENTCLSESALGKVFSYHQDSSFCPTGPMLYFWKVIYTLSLTESDSSSLILPVYSHIPGWWEHKARSEIRFIQTSYPWAWGWKVAAPSKISICKCPLLQCLDLCILKPVRVFMDISSINSASFDLLS